MESNHEAHVWFEALSETTRSRLITTIHRLCLTTKDSSHELLINALNSEFDEKLEKSNNEIKDLKRENEILLNINKTTTDPLNKELSELKMYIVNLSAKLTPSVNGKIGENHIEQILGSIPNTHLENITQTKGSGDFLFVYGAVKFMIESKNWTDSTFRKSPSDLDLFKQDAIIAKSEHSVDIAIMVLHRVTTIKGRLINIDTLHTEKGPVILIYITNTINYPERLVHAIDTGISLLKNQPIDTESINKFMISFNESFVNITTLENSVKERYKIIKSLVDITDKDIECISCIKKSFNNKSEEDIVDLYSKLMLKTKSITKAMLESECKNAGIQFSNSIVLKEIKEKALRKEKLSLKTLKLT